eukprot:CAMPEP_0202700588 /NCGR_PEP_ID=MMETSP1385-20130828/13766_1 /ASSEMBLY_ACC=CAM_ASM_000861 /TAXON_ID=933848 /ORGANISM="Elphidium margaritaceum" /LENGTH=237 /DNA_ID=CAMNT_0049357805 /DNA_START=55 /DNA_END=768 /DNA_ORIENTATION=-
MPKRKAQHKRSSGGHKPSKSSSTSSAHVGHDQSTSSSKSTIYYIAGAIAMVALFAAFFIYLPSIRRTFGFQDTSIDPAMLRGYRARLRKFYEKYNPEKLDEIDDILEKYRGKEKTLFRVLRNKYEKERKKADKERQRKKDRQRRGVDNDDYIPENESEEEAALRRRSKKEREREKRKQQRQKERGGKDYYDEEWDESHEDKSKNAKYFSSGDGEWRFHKNVAIDEGDIELTDDIDDE